MASSIKNNKNDILCKPCEDRNISTYASGFCTQCSKNMCKTCFDTHKQSKINRDHRWVYADEAGSSNYVFCNKHAREPIKFFCHQHDQIGCGDCMIREHKTCTVDYIHDLMEAYRKSKEFKQFKKDVEKSCNEAKKLKTSINSNKDQIKDINKKFKSDVNKFKDDLISHITKQTNALLQLGDDIMATDLGTMDSLEKENEGLIGEMSRFHETLRSLTGQPYRMFIASTEYKKNLHQIKEQLDIIKGKDNFERYAFKCDGSLEPLLLDSQQLGSLQKNKQTNETAEETEAQQVSKIAMEVPMPPKCQRLIDRQLIRSNNISVEGDCISYAAKVQGKVGLYADNRVLHLGDSFEIELLATGRDSTIALGLIPEDFPENLLPGLGPDSKGYHSNGKVYSNKTKQGGCGQAWKVGDHVRCFIKGVFIVYDAYSYLLEDMDFRQNAKVVRILPDDWRVHFIQSGNVLVFKSGCISKEKYHFAVGMSSKKDKVKVIFDSKPFMPL